MKFLAAINVMPKKEILDPQGKAVKLGLENLGIRQTTDVRIGKHITLELEAEDEPTARQLTEEACRRLLANLIMEEFSFQLSAVS
jgi:phosphoribosylformylglycinamidine synthase subunit PurS